MKDSQEKVLEKASRGLGLSFREAYLLLEVKNKDFDRLLQASFKLFLRKTGGVIRFYENAFPPVSVTGFDCELNCNHCYGYYLKHMIPAKTSEKLVKVCEKLYRSGIKGVLLSGGSRKDGTVPLDLFLDAIKIIKKRFGLWIEAHTGPINYKSSFLLSKAGLDAVLPDVVGDSETVREVYGLSLKPKDYASMLNGMVKAGIRNISPHVCVGLHFGKLKGELKALEIVSRFNPSVVVLTVFIPTKGTPMEKFSPPKPEDVAKIVSIANLMFPKTPVSLGCVRPGGTYRNLVDRLAVKAGVSRIAVPSKSAFDEAEKLGLKIKVFHENMCCCVEKPETLKTLK